LMLRYKKNGIWSSSRARYLPFSGGLCRQPLVRYRGKSGAGQANPGQGRQLWGKTDRSRRSPDG
jgi:hypothetical protein